jgi:hypothetical protein
MIWSLPVHFAHVNGVVLWMVLRSSGAINPHPALRATLYRARERVRTSSLAHAMGEGLGVRAAPAEGR